MIHDICVCRARVAQLVSVQPLMLVHEVPSSIPKSICRHSSVGRMSSIHGLSSRLDHIQVLLGYLHNYCRSLLNSSCHLPTIWRYYHLDRLPTSLQTFQCDLNYNMQQTLSNIGTLQIASTLPNMLDLSVHDHLRTERFG